MENEPMATLDQLQRFLEISAERFRGDSVDMWTFGEFVMSNGNTLIIENYKVNASNWVIAKVALWAHAMETHGENIEPVWNSSKWEVRDKDGMRLDK